MLNILAMWILLVDQLLLLVFTNLDLLLSRDRLVKIERNNGLFLILLLIVLFWLFQIFLALD